MTSNKLSATQIILLAFMLLIAAAIIGFGILLVIRMMPPSPAINPETQPPAPTIPAPWIASFTADPEKPIHFGDCILLNWHVDGSVDKISVLRSTEILLPSAPPKGGVEDCPQQTGSLEYQIKATGIGESNQSLIELVVL